ncbi:MAG: transposase [Nitrososphaerales archaeon]
MTDKNKLYVRGQSRDQLILFPGTIEEYIDEDNAARVIDLFVEGLNLEKLGFNHLEPKDDGGRPPYDPRDMLKLYLYGYLFGIRTSRKLERECKRNVELMWLLKKLTPDHRTISDFRKDNVDCIKKVFNEFVSVCKSLDLIGGELVGIDGTKLKAVNSKSRNFNPEKLKYRIERLEKHISEYLEDIKENDRKEQEQKEDVESSSPTSNPAVPPTAPDPISRKEAERQANNSSINNVAPNSSSPAAANELAKKEIEKMEKKKLEYERILKLLKETGQKEISFTDPESRLMKNNEKFEVCYNGQIAVDAKKHLVVAYRATNDPVDRNLLYVMARAAKEAIDGANDSSKKELQTAPAGSGDSSSQSETNSPQQQAPQQSVSASAAALKVTADSAYYKYEEMKKCLDDGITPYVPETGKSGKFSGPDSIPKRGFYKDRFVYDKQRDSYTCPAGRELPFKRWFTDSRTPKKTFKLYRTLDACKSCPFMAMCTKDKQYGRTIIRWKDEEMIEQLKLTLKTREGSATAAKRKELCEHPFGTIKRALNQGYLLLKGLRKVDAEVGFSALAYDMRRAINILGVEILVDWLVPAKPLGQ